MNNLRYLPVLLDLVLPSPTIAGWVIVMLLGIPLIPGLPQAGCIMCGVLCVLDHLRLL